jgi:hypothetical protein
MPDGGQVAGAGRSAREFRLCELEVGELDKLGNKVLKILWSGANYIVYRSALGVYVQFSDDPEEHARADFAWRNISKRFSNCRTEGGKDDDKCQASTHTDRYFSDGVVGCPEAAFMPKRIPIRVMIGE